jgi:hypothetical protein
MLRIFISSLESKIITAPYSNDKYVELFLQKKELEKQLKEIEMEIIKYF